MMSNDYPQGGRSDATARSVAQAVHETAQPLTTLQGLLELSLAREQTIWQYRRSVENALDELQRITDSFGRIRQLVGVRHAMDSSHLMVQCLIDTVSRDLQKKLDATGVKLFLQPQKDTSGKLFTEHVSDLLVEYSSAVSLVISGLLTFMTSGDQIEVSVENDQEDILLRILSSCPLDALHAIPESDSGSMSACLRLAQETLAGHGGSVKVCHPPSTIFISLPINSAQAAAILVEKRMAHHV